MPSPSHSRSREVAGIAKLHLGDLGSELLDSVLTLDHRGHPLIRLRLPALHRPCGAEAPTGPSDLRLASRPEVGGRQFGFQLVGTPDLRDAAVHHDRRESATPSTVRANCSTTRIDTPSRAIWAHDLVELLDDDRRETHRELVEQEQARVRSRAPRAIASICCSPPDNVPGDLRAPVAQAREARRYVTSSMSAERASRVGHHAQVLAHGEVREDASAFGDEAQAARARSSSGRAPLTRRPATITSPALGACSPDATRSVVVLPAPFGPSSATTEPARHGEVDAVQHVDAVVRGANAAQLEQRFAAARRCAGRRLGRRRHDFVPR